MALGTDPTPPGRPAKARPAARARVVATVGSVGALVGITAGIALNASSSDADTGTAAQAPTTTAPARRDDGWARPDDRSAPQGQQGGDLDGDGRVGDPGDRWGRDDDDHWWDEGGSDDGWRAPAPQQAPQQAPQSDDGGWSSPVPQQQVPQTRSAGS